MHRSIVHISYAEVVAKATGPHDHPSRDTYRIDRPRTVGVDCGTAGTSLSVRTLTGGGSRVAGHFVHRCRNGTLEEDRRLNELVSG